jgi:excinuclease ABC subunit C
VTFQRRRREKRGSLSVLDTIPGIGPKRKKQLLTRFKGLKHLSAASVEDLVSMPGITEKLAKQILARVKAETP